MRAAASPPWDGGKWLRVAIYCRRSGSVSRERERARASSAGGGPSSRRASSRTRSVGTIAILV